jgi:hypothetical protein
MRASIQLIFGCYPEQGFIEREKNAGRLTTGFFTGFSGKIAWVFKTGF